jgi:hypothetical protein
MTLLTDPSFLSTIVAAFVTGVFGPVVLQYIKVKFRKTSDPLHQELKLSNIINEKLLEVQDEIESDRIWIAQFHNGGHFYPTGKSIQKFSIIYEVNSPGVSSIQSNFQNIPVNLFSKSINHILEEGTICISDYKNENIPTYGLRYIANETGCKSSYLFAIHSLDGKFISMLGIDFVRETKVLPEETINNIENIASAIGSLLGELSK